MRLRLTATCERRLALDVFVRAIRHYVGAFLLELGGVDVMTFSGGIGENSEAIRSAVCRGLAGFGIELDESVNGTARKARAGFDSRVPR